MERLPVHDLANQVWPLNRRERSINRKRESHEEIGQSAAGVFVHDRTEKKYLIAVMYPFQLWVRTLGAELHHDVQNSMEAILSCYPALSTEWLGGVVMPCEVWHDVFPSVPYAFTLHSTKACPSWTLSSMHSFLRQTCPQSCHKKEWAFLRLVLQFSISPICSRGWPEPSASTKSLHLACLCSSRLSSVQHKTGQRCLKMMFCYRVTRLLNEKGRCQ